MSSETQFVTLAVLLVAFVANAIVRRRSAPTLRPLPALESLKLMQGESVESNRPLHVSLGAGRFGAEDTPLSLVGAEFFYESLKRISASDAAPIFSVGESSALPLARATLRRAYTASKANYHLLEPRWYPSEKPFALAGGVMALQADDHIAGNILIGRWGIELALILDHAARRQLPSIAYSNNLQGQAVAYAMTPSALIGEEGFAVSAYIAQGDEALTLQKRLISLDVLRWLTVATLFILFVVAIVQEI